MTCAMCGDKGLVKVNWSDAPPDYAVCLCPVGENYRFAVNAGKPVEPQWLVWCARNGVDPAQMFLLEEVLTADELREAGFAAPASSRQSREAALLAAGKRSTRR